MKTNIKRQILEYLLAFCIILEFNTTYLVFPVIEKFIQVLPIFILVCLIAKSNYSIQKRLNLQVFIYSVGALFPMLIIDNQFYGGYIIRFFCVLPLLWIYLNLRKKEGEEEYLSLFYKVSNLTVIIALISLTMWLLCSIMKIIPVTAYIPYSWGKDYVGYVIPTYCGIYFETQYIPVLGETISRNTSIFNEGPMYNMVLCIAFSIEYFLRIVKSKVKLWILAIAILSTITTTGQFFLVFFVGWFLYKIGSKYRLLLTLLLPFLIYFIIQTSSVLMDVKNEMGGESSVNDRARDIELCINVAEDNPIFGVGMIVDKKILNGERWGHSNSLFALYAQGGVYVLTFYLVLLLFLPYRYYRKYKDYRWLFTMICFFLIFTITISYMKYLTFLFLAWGLSNIELKKWHQLI